MLEDTESSDDLIELLAEGLGAGELILGELEEVIAALRDLW